MDKLSRGLAAAMLLSTLSTTTAFSAEQSLAPSAGPAQSLPEGVVKVCMSKWSSVYNNASMMEIMQDGVHVRITTKQGVLTSVDQLNPEMFRGEKPTVYTSGVSTDRGVHFRTPVPSNAEFDVTSTGSGYEGTFTGSRINEQMKFRCPTG